MRHSVSSLALGGFGWIQSLNFILAGLLTLAFAVGVRRALRPQNRSTWGPLLIGLWGVDFSVRDSSPPIRIVVSHQEPRPDPASFRAWHPSQFSAGLGFPALLAAFLVFARHFARRAERGWALYSTVSGALFAISFVLAFYGFGRTEGLGAVGGLFERIAAVGGFGWLAALATHLLIQRSAKHAR